LVTENGFCISLASEWIINDNNKAYDKQDCEQKAFKRLSKKLKQAFVRLFPAYQPGIGIQRYLADNWAAIK